MSKPHLEALCDGPMLLDHLLLVPPLPDAGPLPLPPQPLGGDARLANEGGAGGALPPWVVLLGPAGAAEIGLSNTSHN